MNDTIPLFKPSCGPGEIEAVTRVLKSRWWGMGPETEAFENEFAAYTNSKFAVAVNSGTMALELAARATGLTDGVVVMPALTFVSTAQAMRHAGNVVEFADIREDTLCLDFRLAKKRLDSYARFDRKGIVPVWYGGNVDTRDVSSQGVPVIEDCAHAAGAARAGKLGNAAAWSFHAVKNLATGDGGMVTTNNAETARRVRLLRWCGIDRSTWDRDKDARIGYGWDYDIQGDGEKAHMNDITAAIGRVQLRELDKHNFARHEITQAYTRNFRDIEWLSVPLVNFDGSAHLYVIRVPATQRARFIQYCIANGVSAGVHYKPLTYYKPFGYEDPEPYNLPVTNRVWKTLVTLPLFPDMTEAEIAKVISTVRSFPCSSR